MELTAKQIADLLKGTVEGNPQTKVHTFSRIEEGKEGALVFMANMKYEKYIYTTKASIILLSKEYKLQSPINATIIRVEDPYTGIARLLDYYKKTRRGKPGIAKSAIVSKTAKIGKNSFIGENTVIGENVTIGENCYIYHNISIHDNVTIGNDCIIYSGVVIMDDCKIGHRCIFQPNCVIGSDGFGFAPQPDGF
ncbi:MAG: LpxD N-terminal domain-containing protein, partial [Bacteroidales bacterium]